MMVNLQLNSGSGFVVRLPRMIRRSIRFGIVLNVLMGTLGLASLQAQSVDYRFQGKVIEISNRPPGFNAISVGDELEVAVSFPSTGVTDLDPSSTASLFFVPASKGYQSRISFAQGLTLQNTSSGSVEIVSRTEESGSLVSFLLFSLSATDGLGGGDMQLRFTGTGDDVFDGATLPSTLAGSQLLGTSQLFMVYGGGLVSARMELRPVPESHSLIGICVASLGAFAQRRRRRNLAGQPQV